MNATKLIPVLLAAALLSGCSLFGRGGEATPGAPKAAGAPAVARYDGPESKTVSLVYTTKRELSLTFDGMADKDAMERLLDELDAYGIKATFFLPGMRVAEEPDIAKDILARGHEIENNTLSRPDAAKLTYAETYREIKLGGDVIARKTGAAPRYVRTMSGAITDDVRLAAAQSGLRAVVGSSLFLHNWKDETPEQKRNYIRKYINRGGILELDTEENRTMDEDVKLIAEGAKRAGYGFVTLDRLVRDGGERKPLEDIPGWDAAKMNSDYADADYNVMYDKAGDAKKEVVLSFDDWGTDETVTPILDTLANYGVKASFFLRADGVERNPNLARAIAEGGHDVGNHTYSHPVITSVTPAQLQEEIVKAHRIITEAIQARPAMIFRPPTGEFDAETLKAVGATGYRDVAIFDVTPDDFVKTRTAAQIARAVKAQTKSGSVVLLHMLDDIQTVHALPAIIGELRAEGFAFVRMSELMGAGASKGKAP
ncbi:Peptidoglycan/xylan/chitin deacetylase, PgdA/CDA1 family [Paenibacillus sp. UNC496MF]|uniref:polysaccharide deacetylase family protein n=1 Tax=Paenibacillus sp. UNC496MF TaxID=1502753 RepID=UPI0008E102C0|nr:polysaccharide deacetylase family protein [Paenibacillus sp. UNC496MF]SFI78956.1 Peptidoglycan/xylan/chitin deacetylase, PgdA/CDA1 family [Paenibacillus sp. UNC496MF]